MEMPIPTTKGSRLHPLWPIPAPLINLGMPRTMVPGNSSIHSKSNPHSNINSSIRSNFHGTIAIHCNMSQRQVPSMKSWE